MRILSLTHWDFGGCGWFLSDAINRYTEHESRAVCQHPLSDTYLCYPRDISAPSAAQVHKLFKWCDLVHVHDINPYDFLPLYEKPVVISYNGTMYIKLHKRFDAHDDGHGWPSTVTTLNLTLRSSRPRWLPCCRPDLGEYAARPKADGFRVVHAPTKRQYKNTDDIVPILESLKPEGVTFDIIERISWRECLERKARGHLLIDQFTLGIGCNAIEAWLMGMPVISNGNSAIKAGFRKRAGCVPFTEATLGTLRDTVLRFKNDEGFYREELARGQRYVNEWHTQPAVAKMAVALYEEAIRRFEETHRQQEKQAPAAAAVGEDGLVLLEYVGGNNGLMDFWGNATGQKYVFGDMRTPKRDWRFGYVDKRDVPGMLKTTRNRPRPQFRRVA